MAAAGERSHCFPSRANGASIERPIKGKTTATPLNNIPLRPRLEVLCVHACVWCMSEHYRVIVTLLFS